MAEYVVDGARSSMVVRARSAIHDVHTTWSRLRGRIRVDAADPTRGAEATITVDMRVFDAGDRLKNWKLRGDLDPDRWPEATFTLARLEGVRPGAGGRIEAAAVGTLRWRDREVPIKADGWGLIGPDRVEAAATFELDVRDLGVSPPKFFVFKMDSDVRVQVRLEAGVAGAAGAAGGGPASAG